MKIETERLILRTIKKDDANDIYEYAKSEKVGPMAGWAPHKSLEETKAIIKHVLSNDSLAIVLKETNKVIGTIGLMKRSEIMYEIGYSLHYLYWGKGYTPEAAMAIIDYAFKNNIAQILISGHEPNNYQSKRVIEKCGLKYEGLLRKAFLNYDGRYLDYVRYSLLKEEYMEEKNGR